VSELEGFRRTAYNLKLTDIQAAIGIVQMARLPDFVRERHRVATAYREQARDLPGIELPDSVPEECDVHQAFICRWAPFPMSEMLSNETSLAQAVSSLKGFKAAMISGGVAMSDAGQFLPGLPVFRASGVTDAQLRMQYPYAYIAAATSFALPMFPWMRHEDQARIVDRMKLLCCSSRL
jgi:dTDP-4-amino-4,6-dideoxygalactose transaminase